MTVTPPELLDGRAGVLEAAFRCVARFGFVKTTMEDVAREAGLSRATVYRHFPGGRDALFSALVAWEMDRFFARMAAAVAEAADFASVVEQALAFAHREIRDHAALQKILATEPDRLLRFMTLEQDRLQSAVAAYLRPMLEREARAGNLVPGVEVGEAARFVATLGLSLMATPGRFDLDDPGAVRDLTRHELLGGILRRDALDP